jgi:hypothetical protein
MGALFWLVVAGSLIRRLVLPRPRPCNQFFSRSHRCIRKTARVGPRRRPHSVVRHSILVAAVDPLSAPGRAALGQPNVGATARRPAGVLRKADGSRKEPYDTPGSPRPIAARQSPGECAISVIRSDRRNSQLPKVGAGFIVYAWTSPRREMFVLRLEGLECGVKPLSSPRLGACASRGCWYRGTRRRPGRGNQQLGDAPARQPARYGRLTAQSACFAYASRVA